MRRAFIADRSVAHHDLARGERWRESSGSSDAQKLPSARGRELLALSDRGRRAHAARADQPDRTFAARDDVERSEGRNPRAAEPLGQAFGETRVPDDKAPAGSPEVRVVPPKELLRVHDRAVPPLAPESRERGRHGPGRTPKPTSSLRPIGADYHRRWTGRFGAGPRDDSPANRDGPRPGGARDQLRVGRGSVPRTLRASSSGSSPARSRGTENPSSCSILAKSRASSGEISVSASPRRWARAVRPTRCTYVSGSCGTS